MSDKGTLTVPPSDRVFTVLGNNDYDDIDLISELIDNAVAARIDGEMLQIEIEVGISEQNPGESYFLIRDNASGIKFDDLPKAISPAGVPSGSDHPLNEHGLGMKQAIAAAGDLDYIKTKPPDEKSATVIQGLAYGDIDYETEEVDWQHGTEIRISELNEVLRNTDQVYGFRIKSYLGARYRRLLGPPENTMRIEIKWKDIDKGAARVFHPDVVKPIYFHPSERSNRPVVHKEEFSGNEGEGWKAELTFGYAPRDEAEYEELGLKPPKNYEPYYTGLSKQGLDLIRHNRVIRFHQLHQINLVNTVHPQFNHVRGEIDLLEGFSTAITKNKITWGVEFEAMINQIREYLEANDYLDDRHAPSDIPEPCLRDRLADLLADAPYSYADIETEYVIEGLTGFIDILADGEAWELKVNQADGLDVYQLFAYMDMGGIEEGHLVANGQSTGASQAMKHIETNHGLSIEFIDRDNLAINQPMSPEELNRYV